MDPLKNKANDSLVNPQSIAKSASYIALGTFSSRLLGLLRDALFGALFSRTVTDAWLVAFRLPNMFRRLFGEGALTISFVPFFVKEMGSDKELSSSQKLANGTFTLLMIILCTLTLLGIIFSRPLVMLIAGEEAFLSVPGKFELTVVMNQIMFVFILLICLYAYAMAILNALKKFVLPAFAPVLFNVAMIVSTLLPRFYPQLSNTVLAWGVVAGGFLQMSILIPSLIKVGYFPKFSYKDAFLPAVRNVFQKMMAGIVGMGVAQIAIIVNTRFAASLGEGANSWIFWADRILELPLSLFAVSMGTALLPTLSYLWSSGEKEKMVDTYHQNFRLVLFLAIPSAIGLYILAQPVVELLFYRGKFSHNDLINTALVVKIYAFGIISYSSVRVAAQAFYAIHNTLLPSVVSGVCLLIHFFAAPYFMAQWGLGGLIVSTILSATLNMICLMIAFKKYLGSLQIKKFFLSTSKFLIASSAMGYFASTYYKVLALFHDSTFLRGLMVLIYVAVSFLIYFIVSIVLHTEEAKPVWSNLKKRMRVLAN